MLFANFTLNVLIINFPKSESSNERKKNYEEENPLKNLTFAPIKSIWRERNLKLQSFLQVMKCLKGTKDFLKKKNWWNLRKRKIGNLESFRLWRVSRISKMLFDDPLFLNVWMRFEEDMKRLLDHDLKKMWNDGRK